MNKLTGLIIFALGFGMGSLVTMKLLKKRNEEFMEERIEPFMEAMEKSDESNNDGKPFKDVSDDVDKEQVEEMVKDLGYETVSDLIDESESKPVKDYRTPYVISPDDFGEMDDYETITLTYYADGVLTDDNDDEIEDVEHLVGLDFSNHFGEYDEGAVFIRNESMKCDYEILQDYRNYATLL